jgi:hypothetical protein
MNYSVLGRMGTILVAAMFSMSALAADDEWQHTIAIYVVGASIDGTAGIGNVTGDVDVSFGDILDNLDGGFMGAYRLERGPWAMTADVMWLGLEQKKNSQGITGNRSSKVEADQVIASLDGAYAITERLAGYAGLRFWWLDVDVNVVLGGPMGTTLSPSKSENWVDPYVGLRYVLPLGERWQIVTKGDVGGFGVGSDFTWHVTAFANWDVTKNFSLMAGARFIDVDYEDGSGSGRFKWDVLEGGPMGGFNWRF